MCGWGCEGDIWFEHDSVCMKLSVSMEKIIMLSLSLSRVSELVAQHEAQRQEDMLALQEKEKR